MGSWNDFCNRGSNPDIIVHILQLGNLGYKYSSKVCVRPGSPREISVSREGTLPSKLE